MDAAQGLVDTARRLAADPSRLELHMEMAELEFACGRAADATRRLERLASAYLDFEMVDEAAAIIDLLEARSAEPEPGAVRDAQTGMTEPMTVVFGVPQIVETAHTEFCQPILLFPDGSPLPGQPGPSATRATPAPRRDPLAAGKRIAARQRPSESRPPVKITSLQAPRLRRPKAVVLGGPPTVPSDHRVPLDRSRPSKRVGPR